VPVNVPRIAVVDYGMGNLFSVKRACEQVGLAAEVTQSREIILNSDGVILPGVGAFGDAMSILETLDLISVLQDVAASGRPIVGICLGMQLLMSESAEFGSHRGLGIIDGEVVRLPERSSNDERVKVPHVGWDRIQATRVWSETLLEGLSDGAFMYFVHSYYPLPAAKEIELSRSRYGSTEFCSSFQRGNIFGCQFHPERSGGHGLEIYGKLAEAVGLKAERKSHV